MSARGIEVTEHLMPGEADDIPPPPLAFRPWVEKTVREREARAYSDGYEDARLEHGVWVSAILGGLVGFLLGVAAHAWVTV